MPDRLREILLQPWTWFGITVFLFVAEDTAGKYFLEGRSMSDLLSNLLNSLLNFADLPLVEFLMIPLGILCFWRAGESVNQKQELLNAKIVAAISETKNDANQLVDGRLAKYDEKLDALFCIMTHSHNMDITQNLISSVKEVVDHIENSACNVKLKQSLPDTPHDFPQYKGEELHNRIMKFRSDNRYMTVTKLCNSLKKKKSFDAVSEPPKNSSILSISDGGLRNRHLSYYAEFATFLKALEELSRQHSAEFLDARKSFYGTRRSAIRERAASEN